MTEREESDQLPEEQPSGAVHDDTDDDARDEAKDSAGADDDGDADAGTASGNPKAAG